MTKILVYGPIRTNQWQLVIVPKKKPKLVLTNIYHDLIQVFILYTSTF